MRWLIAALALVAFAGCGSDDDYPTDGDKPTFTMVFDPATGNTLSCLQQSGVIVWCSP